MSDNIEPDSPENTTSALSHLAFCALLALGIARQDGMAGTPYAENLFLIRWLATAQKQKRFPKSVSIDITWLLERGRKHGVAGKLSLHLEYLWRSCSGNMAAQSDLFRLTYATETLKDQGWDNYVMESREWKSGTILTPRLDNGFYVEKSVLNAAFTPDGRHLHPVPFRIIGDTMTFIQVMAEYSLHARVINSALDHHTVVLEPVAHSSLPSL
ncbi:DUF2913 family protein [Yersinia pseudotuberculosis]|nr:DUF2913 family protein [Yersinia pseudotuberculosis]MBO1551351.1 DUF2913 family protein [Yersinia pseudotuberculosis]MBO1562431.1 DUF2913 family protein [Yersinia pseudotuberculosis]MBO1571404.1 DUF2913 family protein [Yersinia pseudotuberculosis]MBO1586356.1 DUF2913 family protein [Yersinia pseudotuberculosis]MBO1631819.1 DUF2913 family protein [Yersinia pseudotuberculosis]